MVLTMKTLFVNQLLRQPCKRWIQASWIKGHHGYSMTAVGHQGAATEGISAKTVRPHFRCTFSSRSADNVNIVASPYPDIDLRHGISLTHFIMEDFSKRGPQVAMVNGITGEEFTYNDMEMYITRVASALVKMGVQQGDVVTICSPNSPEFAIIYLAVCHMGAVISPVNPLYTSAELSHTMNHSNAKLLITTDDLVGVAKEAVSKSPNVKGIITTGSCDGCRPIRDMMMDDGKSCPSSLDINDKEDIAQLPYSSGTTGLPKGVMLTHNNLVTNIQQAVSDKVMNYQTLEDTLIGVLPFFHIYGGTVTLLAGLRHGLKIVTLPKFEPKTFLSTLQNYRATFVHIVPPIVLFLAKHELVPSYDLTSVHTFLTAAAPVGEEMMNAATDRIGNPNLKFRQGYGLTETSPLTHCLPVDSKKISSIGVPIPNVVTKVVDLDTGEALGQGKEGEIVVKGPNVMKGYYNNVKATEESVKDGWFHTGDIGYYDEESHYYVSDRLKELIKVKGFQVAPAELEALINTHPSVADVAVIGIPDDRSGELPRAYCVLKSGTSASQQDIQEFIKDKVAQYKHLAGGVEFVNSIPKTASGKIQRRFLKSDYLDSGAARK